MEPNAIERNRARTYFQVYAAAAALHFVEMGLAEVRAGRTKTWVPFTVPDEAIAAASPKRCAACCRITW